ncbi:unnamed protein product [Bursaphelenchus okinawaensis]|uniref:Uncharacterized protein n=1 Tax=Bursaphelenchus okinawaensis TaxID=465554 RepID=A0A811LJC4_9BILA|nr:unnamed protein product [Bursaphelenchus okinawaensis]CAG9124725.1 unnamed protein product [Bursaphelenchus okinawaensis]
MNVIRRKAKFCYMYRTSCSTVVKVIALTSCFLLFYSFIAGISLFSSNNDSYEAYLNVDGPYQNDEKVPNNKVESVQSVLKRHERYDVHDGNVPVAKNLKDIGNDLDVDEDEEDDSGDDKQKNNKVEVIPSTYPNATLRRQNMAKCNPIHGKIAVFVAYRKEEYDQKYKIAQETIRCYIKSTDYQLHLVDMFNDPEVNYYCNHTEVFFRKHCAAAVYLKKSDWMLVLDADTAVVNPNHCIEEYIDDRVDLLFYERYFNWEIMSGNYLVRNTDFGRDFLMKWANFEYTKPNSWNGADNGVLQIHIMHTVLPNSVNEKNTCYKLWTNATSYDTYLAYVTCVKVNLGAQRLYPGKLRILRRGHGFARDGFLAYDSYCEHDFMFHGYKQNEIGEKKWESPFETPVDLSKCNNSFDGWNWRKKKQLSCPKIQKIIASFERHTAKNYPKEGQVFPHLALPDVGECWPNCEHD